MMTESKYWSRYLKPALIRGFRIESTTMLGIPDVFGILPSFRPVWIELKVIRDGRDLLDLLRPGQRTFRGDYSPYIPCIVMGVLDSPRVMSIVADVYGRRVSATGDSWKVMTQAVLVEIEKEIYIHERYLAKTGDQVRTATSKKAGFGDRTQENNGRTEPTSTARRTRRDADQSAEKGNS